MFSRFDAELDQQIETGQRGGTGPRRHDLDVVDLLAGEMQRVQNGGTRR